MPTADEIYRDYVVDGVPSSGPHKPSKAEIRNYLGDLENAVALGEPYVILATGQSNMALYGAVSWEPPENVHRWNWNEVDGDVGNAFVPVPSDFANAGWSYAVAFARANPNRQVYVINVAIGGIQIAKWMTGGTGPNMMANIEANVEAALDIIGVDRIDEMLWWQGEGDWNSTTYVADWASVYVRFLGQPWFSWAVPITLFGISVYGTPNLSEFFNANLTRLSSAFTSVRYFNTSSLPIDYWDPADDYVHINGPGALLAGQQAFENAYKESKGGFSNPFYNSWHVPGNVITGPRALQRRGDASTTQGAGHVQSTDGSSLSFTAGTAASGHHYFINDADGTPTIVGSIVTLSASTSYNTTSDQDLKEDDGEMPTEQALEIVRLMQIHSFRWKADDQSDFGVFAQELFEVYPQAVTEGRTLKDGVTVPWSVDYSKLMAPVLRAVQGMDERLSALEAKA